MPRSSNRASEQPSRQQARVANAEKAIASAIPLVPPQAQALHTAPTSLTQVSSRSAARCPVCSGTRLTRIAMVLTDGSPVDFTSCHTCEHRSWVETGGSGGALPIDDVLAKTRKPR